MNLRGQDISKLKSNSHKIILFDCDHCNVEVTQEYRNYIKSKDGLHLCRRCRNKQSVSSDEVRKKIGISTSKKWKDVEYKEKLSKKLSEKKKEWWDKSTEKISFSYIKELLLSHYKSIKQINETWCGKRTKIEITCNCGHSFTYLVSNIRTLELKNKKLNNLCPHCRREKLIYKWKDIIENDGFKFISLGKKNNGGDKYLLSLIFKCDKGHISEIFPTNWCVGQRCGQCWSENNYSKEEKNLLNYIKTLYSGEIVENDRKQIKPKEIDIYIPELKIGIEYNGTYWHSSKFKDKKYHQMKYLECKEKGIRLIQIFEHEWLYKQDKVKSILRNIFGKNEYKIGSRKCILKEIPLSEYRQFLNDNHIQGYTNSTIKIGLYYNDLLISCLGISKSRFNKNQTEIVRFVNKMNYTINGSFNKMLKYYLNNYYKESEEIVSFSDLRYFTGSGYLYNGFEFLSLTSPNYCYTKDGISMFNRIKFQKHKLEKLLDIYDGNKTETENMLENGYLQIFDGGNLKFIYSS